MKMAGNIDTLQAYELEHLAGDEELNMEKEMEKTKKDHKVKNIKQAGIEIDEDVDISDLENINLEDEVVIEEEIPQ